MACQSKVAFALASFALLSCASCFSLQSSPCEGSTMASLRAEWKADDEPCQKLPFELWMHMKAEGSEDIMHCLHITHVGLLELTTPEGYTMSATVEAAPGEVVSETLHATTYKGATAATLEAFCADDNILGVTRVLAHVDSYGTAGVRPGRRLQSTTSEAGQAHQVAELIAGLRDLGCKRTTGEDQTVCVMSDSFNARGNATALQASGDLPHVEVVKEFEDDTAIDEGSAMIEIMYDISSGSTYKFNTAFLGAQTFADDIGVLASEEQCDVIVDDIGYRFQDGVIAAAVDEAVDHGTRSPLYFSSAGNFGTGFRFTSNFECTGLFVSEFNETAACETGVPSHVFQPEAADRARYFYPLNVTSPLEILTVHWDSDIGAAGNVVLGLWAEEVSTGDLFFQGVLDFETEGNAVEVMLVLPLLLDDGETVNPAVSYHLQMVHVEERVDDIEAEFLLISTSGVSGQSDGSIFGHPCASKAVAVAAMDWVEGDGSGGAFEDPELSPVESFSSRGPCIVNGETRLKPTTTAADGVTTSTPGFETFFGTSASAPAAAAIATIIRAACYPKVVGYGEIMDMLTNYKYTIDYTNDAGGAPKTWGTEAGHGIISARQMLRWVKANCFESCPGPDSSSRDSRDSREDYSYSFGDEWWRE